MKNTKRYILDQLEKKQIDQQEAVVMLKELQEKESNENGDIAIIGASCRVPMAENKEEFWDNILNGRNCFTPEPIEKLKVDKIYSNPYYAEYLGIEPFGKENEDVDNYVGAFIKDFDKFDAAFFGIAPREASYIEPQQRIFLEAAWTAIEDAGYSVDSITGSKTGVFLGCDGTNSINYKNITEYDSMIVSGTWKGILASRINYIYDLKGPAILIDTACSSGLVAIHEACKSLRNKECAMALTGGIAISAGGAEQESSEDLLGNDNEGDAISMVSSKDNKIRAFDNKCSGTVFGEGVVVLMLKPLKDAERDHDHVYGVIKGSAINNDGASNGLTAPNPAAQEAVIVDAWKNAKVEPESISYIETHGTGTLLGDPIEVLGLTNAFSRFTDKKQFCGIGSVKSNIGHIVAASGCANVLKVVMSMNYQRLPPSIYFDEPNTHINFIDSPVYVVDQPTEWKAESGKLRAGISAFGFSGTNCHLILEEYNVKKKETKRDGLHLFVVSAKTKSAIHNTIRRYVEYFKLGHEERIEDICYVSGTGRGHYTYRVAMIVRSLDELKSKIAFLNDNSFESNEKQQIYVGESYVISDKRQAQAKGEIRESELREISKQANVFVAMNEHSMEQLEQLAQLYIQGSNVNWVEFYKDEDVDKVPLPTYQFDRTPYWGVEKVSKVEGSVLDHEKDFDHALVKKCIVESMHESIYQVNFNLSKHWVLQEHRIMGSNIVSGTTFIEIIIEALRKFYHNDKVVLGSVLFFEPLVVTEEDDDVETQIIITKGTEHDDFLVVSKHYDTKDQVIWSEHVKGYAYAHEDGNKTTETFAEVVNNENLTRINFKLPESNAGFGPRWLSIKQLYRQQGAEGDIIYSEMRLDDKYLHDLQGYRFHPALLDDAINMAVFQYYTGAELYLPFTYQNMKVYGDIPSCFYSKIRMNSLGHNSEIISFHIELVDIDGNVIAEVEECAIKKVNKFNDYVANNFYGLKWIEAPEITCEKKILTGNVLIFTDQSGLSDKLGAQISNESNTIYYINCSKEYKKLDDSHYEVGASQESYSDLMNGIGIDKVSTVYHLATVNFNKAEYDLEEYEEAVNLGLNSLLYLTQIFMHKMKGNTDFILVSDCAHEVTEKEDYIKPSSTSFLALAKTLQDECPGYHFRCIDIDNKSDEEQVRTHILSNNDEFRIALRENKAYLECLYMVDIERKVENEVMIRTDGVYIVTGGTGGLGLEVASNFSDFEACNICLIARREVPSRDQWNVILEKNEDSKLCNLIQKVCTMERKGANVVFKKADVGDFDQMKVVIDELEKEFVNICGIVHCAGMAGDGIIYNKTIERFKGVINPKIYGTINLDYLTRDHKLDFFVLYSSMQTLFGGTGQGDYTAANAFLDSYPAYLKKKGRVCQAINWPGWSEIGMAVDYQVADSVTLFKSIMSQVGINAFNNMVRYNLSNLIPGDMNFEVLGNIGVENFPIRISDQLMRSLKRYQDRKNSTGTETRKLVISRENLIVLGKSEDDYTKTEKDVAYIYAAVLNITEVDIYENFSSMGGDSIIATEVIKVLNSQYENVLNVSDIFTYSTIEEMSAYIAEKLGRSQVEMIEENNNEQEEDIISMFASGEIDVDSMLDYLDEEQK